MAQPIVIAHHLIWTAYGWWLPNDPRGSGSNILRNDVIGELGELHHGRKRVQPAGVTVRNFYHQAASVLKHPLLTFASIERREITSSFAQVIKEQCYTCYACAILPDHVHILIRKHKHQAEQMIETLKEASRTRLHNFDPRFADHRVWASGGGWKVFLDHPDDVRRAISYIERNPLPLGLPKQEWGFVTKYDGWPLHPGHSPNSPYARRLRESEQ